MQQRKSEYFVRIEHIIFNLEDKGMKQILIIMLLLATLASPAYAEEDTCDMLFVQDAKAMAFDGSRKASSVSAANPEWSQSNDSSA